MLVAGDAYDFHLRVFPRIHADALAHGILIRPKARRHGLVHDGNRRRRSVVRLREGASANNRNPHRLEIARAYAIVEDSRRLLAGLRRMVLHKDVRPIEEEAHRHAESQGSRLHSRERFGAPLEFTVEIFSASLIVARPLGSEAGVQDVAALKAEIQVLGIVQITYEQPGHNQQDQRSGHLTHHQETAEPLPRWSAAPAMPAVAEHRGGTDTGGAKSRPQADRDAGEHGRPESVGENPPIEAEIQQNRKVRGQIERPRECIAAPLTKGQPDCTPGQGQHQAFGQHLADEARSAGAQRGADRHFAFANGGADQKKIGHVHARQQQHQPGQQQDKPANQRSGVGQETERDRPRHGFRCHAHRDAFFRFGMLLLQAARHHIKGALGFAGGDTRLETPQHGERPPGTVGEDLARKFGHIQNVKTEIAVHVGSCVGSVEALWSDADHPGRLAVDSDLPADDPEVAAKTLLPVGMRQNTQQLGPRLLAFPRRQETTGCGLQSQAGEEIPGDGAKDELRGFAI